MQNRISHSVHMHVADDEAFVGEHTSFQRQGTLVLDAFAPERTDLTTGKCGGGRRVDLRVVYRQAAGGAVSVGGRAALFEADRELPDGHDGRAEFSGTVSSGASHTFALRVRNAGGYGDFADIQVAVSNLALSETDPCANLQAKAAALGPQRTGGAVSACEAVRGGHRRRFEHADLYDSPSTGAHEVRGDIRRKYDGRGGPDGDLALPVTDEEVAPDGLGRYTHFSGQGSIYAHPRTGPMVVRGEIRTHWAQSGGERGVYGYPTSDELTIGHDPAQSYSDFQNGVIFLENGVVVDPVTAHLSAAEVLAAFAAAFGRRAGADRRVQIGSVAVVGIGDTTPHAARSGNRIITCGVSGEIGGDPWFLPTPAFGFTLPVLFSAFPPPDGRREVTLQVRQAGVGGLHAGTPAGTDGHDQAQALRDRLTPVLSQPVTLGRVPAAAGLLSFKVMQDGGLTLYFRPDVAGRFAVGAAQDLLDHMQL